MLILRAGHGQCFIGVVLFRTHIGLSIYQIFYCSTGSATKTGEKFIVHGHRFISHNSHGGTEGDMFICNKYLNGKNHLVQVITKL